MRQFLRRLAFAAALLIPAAAGAQTITPEGRLTLTSGSPVMGADKTAATTVYYDCYAGNVVPVGATLANLIIPSCEISTGLAAANVLSGSVYDVFGISNAGTLALCAGPAWTSTTARGSGAGTTQLDQTDGGIWTNTNSLTHCWGGAAGTTDYGPVAAHAATYLGSLYATAAGQTGMQFAPAAAAGGPNAVRALYNSYNRVDSRTVAQDSAASWTYNSATWRAADNSANNRIAWLDGLGQSPVSASYVGNATAIGEVGVAFDSATAIPGGIVGDANPSINAEIAGGNVVTALGWHYAQAMEAVRSGTATFYCSYNAANGTWCGLSLDLAD